MTDNSRKLAVDEVQKAAQDVSEHYKKYNHVAFIDLHEKLLNDKKLYEEFVKNPNKVVERETGIPSIKGAHYHFINEKNEFFPPEGEHEEEYMSGTGQGAWSRLEIRLSSAKGSALATCIILCNKCSD